MFQQSARSVSWVALPLSVAFVTGFSSTAQAASFGVASDYNVFVFGNMTQSSDAEGRVAVGGDATFTNFGIGDRLTNSNGADTRLVVGGDLTYNGGQVFGGNAIVGGTVNTPVFFNCTPNCGVNPGNPIDFVAAQQDLLDLSQQWGSLATTGTAEHKWNGIWLEGNNSDVSVFNIDGSWFGQSTYLNLSNVSSDATLLFNVSGSAVNISNFGLNLDNFQRENIVFNFTEATTLNTTGFSFYGSVLAPQAHYTFNNGNVEGNLIAASVEGTGEFHNYQFSGDLPSLTPRQPGPEPELVSVPEPSLMLGLGVVATSLWTRRRRVSVANP
jgi:choice-of-anchor A domain-containing protein